MVCLEQWIDLLFPIMDGYSPAAVVWFVVLIFVGNFFVMNLFLVIITQQFGSTKQAVAEEREAELLQAEKDLARGAVVPAEGGTVEEGDEESDRVRGTAVGRIVSSDWFGSTIMICIVLNTIIMGTEHHNQPSALRTVQEVANYLFGAVFAVEMGLKLIALGCQEYWMSRMNAFDGTIVLISLLELALSGDGAFSVFRAFRVLRVFKLVKFMPGIQRQLTVLVESISGMGNFLIILSLFIFIYAVFGMYIFGNKFDANNDGALTDDERKNFDTLLWALVSVFQVHICR